MFYLDTSVFVAAATPEAESRRVQLWIAENADLALSDWVATEFSAALARKVRMHLLDPEEKDRALFLFRREAAAAFRWLAVGRKHFRAASRFASRPDLGLRGGDALHLAVAAGHDATLCTLDRRQAEAGAALDVKTLLL